MTEVINDTEKKKPASASTRGSTPNLLFSNNAELKQKEEAERRKTERHLLGELSVDKHYLEELLKLPGIIMFK